MAPPISDFNPPTTLQGAPHGSHLTHQARRHPPRHPRQSMLPNANLPTLFLSVAAPPPTRLRSATVRRTTAPFWSSKTVSASNQHLKKACLNPNLLRLHYKTSPMPRSIAISPLTIIPPPGSANSPDGKSANLMITGANTVLARKAAAPT